MQILPKHILAIRMTQTLPGVEVESGDQTLVLLAIVMIGSICPVMMRKNRAG